MLRAALRPAEWRGAAAAHRARVRGLLRGGLDAGTGGLRADHPVFNFLRSYYFVRSAADVRKKLLRWSPGALARLQLEPAGGGPEADLAGLRLEERPADDGAPDGPRRLEVSAADEAALRFAEGVLEATTKNAPVLNCFGMHEWAMLYQQGGEDAPFAARFQDLPRRVAQEDLNATVRAIGVNCTHFDAMRFFAPSSKAHSRHQGLTREQSFAFENPACLHAQMDILRHALKLGALLPSAMLSNSLELALEARALDVSASPYDASSFGLAPVAVETEAGRAEYKARQLQLAQRARPLRRAMLEYVRSVLETRAAPPVPSPQNVDACNA